MGEKLISLLIGYGFGCFLTAEIVARKVAGKRAGEIGDTGNPGMANIMASLGIIPGLVTLAGDICKCLAACLISYGIFREEGRIILLYAGLGCTLGHDFPFWRHFRGGKGVTTTSVAIVLYDFWPGLAANVAGMVVVLATRYLCIGGPVIPLVFTILMIAGNDSQAVLPGIILTVLSLMAHGRAILNIRHGTTKRTDVLRAINNKVKRS